MEDALVLGTSAQCVWVRVPLPAPAIKLALESPDFLLCGFNNDYKLK